MGRQAGRRVDALGTCGAVLFSQAHGSLEVLLRDRNLVRSIDEHLHEHGPTLDPITRALLAASQAALSRRTGLPAQSAIAESD